MRFPISDQSSRVSMQYYQLPSVLLTNILVSGFRTRSSPRCEPAVLTGLVASNAHGGSAPPTCSDSEAPTTGAPASISATRSTPELGAALDIDVGVPTHATGSQGDTVMLLASSSLDGNTQSDAISQSEPLATKLKPLPPSATNKKTWYSNSTVNAMYVTNPCWIVLV
jgi:hypothetical protein